MAVSTIDFTKVIQYSLKNCFQKSQSKCAAYVKKAFEAGGCKYISGNGWNNQRFCEENGFKCIGDFVPVDKNPRPHGSRPMQLPEGYVQQVGDICLIKHGTYGHIVYAAGPTMNDWVSDFWQRPPGQISGMGPYCYTGNVEHVQFWRHSSVMNGSPEVPLLPNEPTSDTVNTPKSSSSSSMERNEVSTISSSENTNKIKNHSGTVLGTHMRQK